MITVLIDRYVRGWPAHEHGGIVDVLPLGDAFVRDWQTDAHFAAYRTSNGRRLTRGVFDLGGSVELTAVVFDVDAPDHGAGGLTIGCVWRRQLRECVQALASVHPGLYYYETRGGSRIVYAQREPTVLSSLDDAREWSQGYRVMLAYLRRRFGIEADPACSDWQRLYRLPRATRTPELGPENWPAWGDPHAIGSLTIEASREDVLAAAQAAPKAFRVLDRHDLAPCSASGDGLLYALLCARGDIIRAHDRGAYVVRCPREHTHTCGTTGDGSTLLYLPAAGEEIGAIHCLHAHCSGLELRDWLREFSESELAEARGRSAA